jgi:uncharacterized Zn finger protein
MKCPNCGERTTIELDMHSEGYTREDQPVKECSACGLVWRVKEVKGAAEIDIIKPAR